MLEVLKIRALIVDDEPDARMLIRDLLVGEHPEVEIVGECVNGYEAVKAVESLAPDLMFLDEKMPEIDGFEVLKRLGERQRPLPLVIFVTGYAEFALKAFDVEPVHYLLKPLDQKRFDEALERAKRQLAAKRPPKYRQYLSVTDTGGRSLIVNTATDIDWINADQGYLEIHGKRKLPLMRETIRKLEAELDPEVFVRIHRSYIVKFELIDEVHYVCNQESWVLLRDGRTRLPLSETGRKKLADRLGKFL